ncbi:MAG TPA: hypothetical protein VJY41_07200 [Prolixibacteraceae bacterium]|nr:hypothetical protein [Prolixibacteraceae bacterium]
MNKILKNTAHLFSFVFHPLVVPSIGFILLFYSLPGFELYPPRMRNIMMVIIAFSTGILPLTFIFLMSVAAGFSSKMEHHRDRMLPYIFSAFSIYMGAQLMGKLPVPGVFRLFMLGACLVLIMLFLITMKWKISGHAAAMGGLTGLFLSLAFRYAIDLKWVIIAAIFVSGIVASSRILLTKHSALQVYLGYGLGLVTIFLTVYLF